MSLAGPAKPKPPRPPYIAFAVALVAFAAIGAWLVKDARGNPATGWMLMFAPGDFVEPGSLRRFLAGLQVAISPWLAALEILSQRWFGSPDAVTVWLYRVAMVGSYLGAIALAWPSLVRLALAFLLSLLFLRATVLIHPVSPIVYDVVFPFLLVAYFGLLRLGAAARREGMAVGALVLGGAALALAELTRPFLIVFVLPLLLGAWFTLRQPRRFAALAVPVVLVSGAWHAHQWINHGQLVWSNHGGFNMARAWRMVPYPELIPEPGDAPVARERRRNLNTPEHGENNRRMRRAVFDYILAHPLDSARHAAERVAVFIGTGHRVEHHAPDDPLLLVYDPVVRYADIAALAALAAMLVALVRAPRRAGDLIGHPNNQMAALIALSLVLIAVTESGEEGRFQLSLLPLMAAIPFPFLPARERKPDYVQDRRRRRWKRAGIAALAVAAIAVVETLDRGARREPAGAAGGGALAPASASTSLADGSGGALRLRVAQFNIRGGAWRDRAAEIAANAACLKELDLAGLAEVRGPGPFGRGENQAAMLAREAGLAALFAPAERRWWSEHFGNALLYGVPILQWERASLPRDNGISHRSVLAADVQVGRRTVRILVSQIDNIDYAVQIRSLAAVFRAAPAPAILLADFGSANPRAEPLRGLVEDPGLLVLTNQPPFPAAQGQGGYIIAKGVRQVGTSLCKGGVSMQPRLAAELAIDP